VREEMDYIFIVCGFQNVTRFFDPQCQGSAGPTRISTTDNPQPGWMFLA
jgi:hypothetical protein